MNTSDFEVGKKPILLMTLLLIFIVAGLTFFPLIMVRFSTADDVAALSEQLPKTFSGFIDRLDLSESGGRLSYWGTTILGMVRILVDSQAYQAFLRIFSIGLTFAMTSLVCGLALESFGAGAIVFVCLLLGMQNWWGHHIVSAFPFNFHIAFAILLLSFAPYAAKKTDIKWSVFGAFLYFLACMCYELFVPYIIVYPLLFALLSFTQTQLTTFKSRFIWLSKRTLPYALSVLVFSLAYLVVRHLYRDGYDGVEVAAGFSPRNYLRTVWIYSVSSLPPSFFYRSLGLAQLFSDSFHPFDLSIRSWFENMRLEWLVREFLAAALVCLFFRTAASRLRNFSIKSQLAVAALVTMTVFLPNVLLSLSRTKQEWAIQGLDTYSGSFFSFVSLIVLILLMYSIVYNWLSRIPIAKNFLVTILAVTVFSVGIKTDVNNFYVSKAQANDYLMWRTMRSFLGSQTFADLPEGAVIYAPTLWQSGRFWPIFHPTHAMDIYWDRMAMRFADKSVHFVRYNLNEELAKLNKEPKDIFHLVYGTTTQGRDAWLVLGRLPSEVKKFETDQIGSSEVKFLVVSGGLDLGILFSTKTFARQAIVSVEGNLYEAYGMNHFVPLPLRNKTVDSLHREYTVGVTGGRIDLQSVRPIVSSQLADFRSRGLIDHELVQGLDAGCFNTENDGISYFQWCRGETVIRLINNTDQTLEVDLSLNIFSGKPEWHLRVNGLGIDGKYVLSSSNVLKLGVRLLPGENLLELHTSDAFVAKAPGDTRDLAFGVRQLTYNVRGTIDLATRQSQSDHRMNLSR